jgi:hypothetical protein
MMSDFKCSESFKVAGNQLVDAVKKLIHEGNVRRVTIRHDGHIIAEFPLTVGLIGVVAAPIVAAVAAIAAIIKECTVDVERVPDEPSKEKGAA